MTDEQRTHFVALYQHGKFAGYVSGKGGCNRLRIHAAQFTEDKAKAVAAEIRDDAENQADGWHAIERPIG